MGSRPWDDFIEAFGPPPDGFKRDSADDAD